MRRSTGCMVVLGLVLGANPALAQERFADLVGPVTVRPVEKAAEVEVPFITWGGDVATFHANGGRTTRQGKIFDRLGLRLRLVPGDDFVGQVRNYMSGKTPLIRGTFRMLGQASEVLGSDPRTKPVVFLQLTWSKGDHVVAREHIKSLNDLKPQSGEKVKIACQRGGPHVGLLDDMLRLARLSFEEGISWQDMDVVWVPDLTGENGPAERFRKDPSVDACCVISPDMIGLCGGLDSVGTGAEGTQKGAHVLVSTANISHSIADVYACRTDWYQGNRQFVEDFVAGYLKAAEEVAAMRDSFEKTAKMSTQYRDLLTMAQAIFGKDVLPTLEVDAHGLLLDCEYAGISGNVAFFQVEGFEAGFAPKLTAALDLATTLGLATQRSGFTPVELDYRKVAKRAGIAYVEPKFEGVFTGAEAKEIFLGGTLQKDTLVTFTINYGPDQTDFPVQEYQEQFSHAIESAGTAGNAVIAIVGHSDPTKTLVELLLAGMEKGLIRQSGTAAGRRYFIKTKDGFRPLDLSQTETVAQYIESGMFGAKPKATMDRAMNLSKERAEKVREVIVDFAGRQGKKLDPNQLQPEGRGIREPLISKPTGPDEAAENRRVEFRILRVSAETVEKSEFDLLK